MTTLPTINFESNKLYDPGGSGFDALYVTGGTIEVNAASKYNGNYGLEVTPRSNYAYALGVRRTNSLKRFRQAFYLHPNGITIPTTKGITISRNFNGDYAERKWEISIRYETGIGYQLTASVDSNDTFPMYNMGNITLTYQAGWNLIESDWYADDAAGFMKIWLNGTSIWNRSVVNGNLNLRRPMLGSFWPNATSGMSGTFYLDYWRANDDGTAIGA